MSNKKRHKTRRETRQFADRGDQFWSSCKPVFYKQLQIRSGLYDMVFPLGAKGKRNFQQTRIKGISRHEAEDMLLASG
jgi:hypothetical protein